MRRWRSGRRPAMQSRGNVSTGNKPRPRRARGMSSRLDARGAVSAGARCWAGQTCRCAWRRRKFTCFYCSATRKLLCVQGGSGCSRSKGRRPSSSGPRCARLPVMASMSRRLTGSRLLKLNCPQMPHIGFSVMCHVETIKPSKCYDALQDGPKLGHLLCSVEGHQFTRDWARYSADQSPAVSQSQG